VKFLSKFRIQEPRDEPGIGPFRVDGNMGVVFCLQRQIVVRIHDIPGSDQGHKDRVFVFRKYEVSIWPTKNDFSGEIFQPNRLAEFVAHFLIPLFGCVDAVE
jgi:hypothetical protein